MLARRFELRSQRSSAAIAMARLRCARALTPALARSGAGSHAWHGLLIQLLPTLADRDERPIARCFHVRTSTTGRRESCIRSPHSKSMPPSSSQRSGWIHRAAASRNTIFLLPVASVTSLCAEHDEEHDDKRSLRAHGSCLRGSIRPEVPCRARCPRAFTRRHGTRLPFPRPRRDRFLSSSRAWGRRARTPR